MLELSHVQVLFGQKPVLQDLSFTLQAGQRLGVLGPSGEGKSTLLRLVAGLIKPDSGQVWNEFRHPVLVFQQPRLLPWRSVLDNVQIPLRAQGLSAAQAKERAMYWLGQVELADVAQSWPGELSGGMAQRVALARAFALQPDLLLLDEPFSALDPALRNSLAQVCLRCLEETGAALLYISHQPRELMRVADSCLLLQKGQGQLFEPVAPADIAARERLSDSLYAQLLSQEALTP